MNNINSYLRKLENEDENKPKASIRKEMINIRGDIN